MKRTSTIQHQEYYVGFQGLYTEGGVKCANSVPFYYPKYLSYYPKSCMYKKFMVTSCSNFTFCIDATTRIHNCISHSHVLHSYRILCRLSHSDNRLCKNKTAAAIMMLICRQRCRPFYFQSGLLTQFENEKLEHNIQEVKVL